MAAATTPKTNGSTATNSTTDGGAGADPARSLRDVPLFAEWPKATFTGSAATDLASGVDAADGTRVGNAAATQVDWALVRRLKRLSADEVDTLAKSFRARHDHDPTPEDLKELGKPVIAKVVADHARSAAATGDLWPVELEDAYFQAVLDSQFGMGRFQPLFEIPDAEDVVVHGQSVKVRHNDGRVESLPPVADSDDELMEQLRQMASNSTPRRAFDAHNVDMTLMIGHQFRVHAISNEISVHPRIVIRQHLLQQISLSDLAVREMMPDYLASFLDAAVRANLTIAVAGEQGAGKTTMLRALTDAIPMDEFFGTLETDLELFAHLMPGRESVAALYARSGMGERTQSGERVGEIGISDMVAMGQRQTLDRFIVGEIRGGEASALFQAMTAGAGSMFTIHSRNAETAAIRLASRVAEGRVYTVEEAMRQIGLLVDLIVYVEVIDDRHRGGTRRRLVSHIAHCSPGDLGRPAISPLYTTDLDGNPTGFSPPVEMLAKVDRHRRLDLHRYEDR